MMLFLANSIVSAAMKLKRALLIAIGISIIAPAAAFAFVKPLRVLVPALMPGIDCPRADICTDNIGKLGEAQTLYQAGYGTATAAVGPFHASPRIVFCTTQACADTFGLGRRAAETVGNFGLIVASRGWKPFDEFRLRVPRY